MSKRIQLDTVKYGNVKKLKNEEKENRGKLFEAGDKYKYWSKEDFVCCDFNCSDQNCRDWIKANVEYGCNEIWFERGIPLGEGGFSKVFQFSFHQRDAAFKKIPIYFQNEKEKAMEEAFKEFEIMKNISKKPKDGDDMIYVDWKQYYKIGMEDLVLSPLGCFYIEDILSGEVWMILIMPKMKNDLNKVKRDGRLDEENTKTIMAQLVKVVRYLGDVRDIRHQDLKPENILLDYKEENKKITNIKVNSILFT